GAGGGRAGRPAARRPGPGGMEEGRDAVVSRSAPQQSEALGMRERPARVRAHAPRRVPGEQRERFAARPRLRDRADRAGRRRVWIRGPSRLERWKRARKHGASRPGGGGPSGNRVDSDRDADPPGLPDRGRSPEPGSMAASAPCRTLFVMNRSRVDAEPVRVAIVEDDAEIRGALELLISGTSGYACVSAFGDCESAIAALVGGQGPEP